MIWIRADANREIGTGHIMRCLSVAAALKECGQEVCFILADDSAVGLLQSRGMDYRILESDYTEMEAELPRLCEWLQKNAVACLLIDSYFVTSKYLEQIGAYTKTAYMDDVNRFPYPVDTLINYNIYGDMLPYREQAVNENECFLLGTAYVPLREEFRNVQYAVKEEAQNVLITTGGSDKYNLAGQILENVLADNRTRHLHYHVVSGAFNQHLPLLKSLEEKCANVHIYQNVTRMSDLMKDCDVAITAGGSTMYELSAIGVPIICFSFVDNQEQIVQTFAGKGIVCYGGDYLVEKEALFENITDYLVQLTNTQEIRQKYREKERQLVDGQGAMRIARAICELGI